MKKMNIREVCEYLEISRSSFYNYVKMGLPVHKMPSGRPFCYRNEIDNWVNKRG